MTYYLMGDNGRAIKEWKEVLSIDPMNERAKMYLRFVGHR